MRLMIALESDEFIFATTILRWIWGPGFSRRCRTAASPRIGRLAPFLTSDNASASLWLMTVAPNIWSHFLVISLSQWKSLTTPPLDFWNMGQAFGFTLESAIHRNGWWESHKASSLLLVSPRFALAQSSIASHTPSPSRASYFSAIFVELLLHYIDCRRSFKETLAYFRGWYWWLMLSLYLLIIIYRAAYKVAQIYCFKAWTMPKFPPRITLLKWARAGYSLSQASMSLHAFRFLLMRQADFW